MAFKSLCLVLCLAVFAMEVHGYKTYVAIRRNIHFFRAAQACRVMGAHLASIDTAAEQQRAVDAIKAVIPSGPSSFWIGGEDYGYEGHFLWFALNRYPVFSDYAPGEPSNSHGYENCLILDSNKNYKWNDVACDAPVDGFLCAFEQ